MHTIAGKIVNVGDTLWHQNLRRHVRVIAEGIIEVGGASNQLTKMAWTTGGLINGVRQLYWHQPLVLDVPHSDISKYQTMLDATKQILES